MIRKNVLHTRIARGVARKAGLVGGGSSALARRPVTLLDAFITIGENAFLGEVGDGFEDYSGAYQWIVDFTGYTEARVSSSSDWNTYLNYSIVDASNELLVGQLIDVENIEYDWNSIHGTYDEPGHPYDGGGYILAGTWQDFGLNTIGIVQVNLGWVILPERARTLCRVAISTQANPGDIPLHIFDSNPFAFTVQAR